MGHGAAPRPAHRCVHDRARSEGRRRSLGDDRHERPRRRAAARVDPRRPAHARSGPGRREAAATAVLGAGNWIDNAHYPNIYFSDAFFAQPAERAEVARSSASRRRCARSRRSRRSVRSPMSPATARPRQARGQPLCLTFDPERSGDLYYLPARGYIMDTEDEPAATAHGSLHDYDREVPLIVLRRAAKPPARSPADADMRSSPRCSPPGSACALASV